MNSQYPKPDIGEYPINIVAAKRYLEALEYPTKPFAKEELISFFANSLQILQRKNEFVLGDPSIASTIWIEELGLPIFKNAAQSIKSQFLAKVKDPSTAQISLSLQIIIDLADVDDIHKVKDYFRQLKKDKGEDLVRTVEFKLFKHYFDKGVLTQSVCESALKKLLKIIIREDDLVFEY